MLNSPLSADRITQPTPRLLQRLVYECGVSLSQSKFNKACEKASSLVAEGNPAEWVRNVLTHGGVKGVQPLLITWRRFDQRRLPALVFYDNAWFFAIKDSSRAIKLISSCDSVMTCGEDALQDAFVLWLSLPPRRSDKIASSDRNISAKMILKEIFRNPGWLVSVLIATMLVNLFAVATSIFAMQVYDRVVPTQAYATLTTLAVGMAIIVGLDWFLKIIRARIIDSLSCEVDMRVSLRVFEHLLHLQLDLQPKSLGALAAQVSGLDAARQFFSSGVVFVLMDIPFALMFIAFIAIIGGVVSWVYILLLPLALTLGLINMFRLRKLVREQIIRSTERQGLLVDTIRGAESIRANNAGWRFSQEWQDITTSIHGYNIQQKAITNMSTTTTGSLSTIAYVSALVVGVMQIEAGNLTMGALIACSILGGRVIQPISQGVNQLKQWENVSQSLRMVDQLLKIATERRADQQLLIPDELPKTIEVEKIRFAYPGSPVQQINIPGLKFKSGERVLLLGPVGCGKSTLLKLLAGLYRPSEGRVRVGNADLWEIDPQVLASHLGYLPQSVHLFKGSLRSNLSLSGREGDSRMLHVVKELGIDAIAASSSLGMELPISEGGEGLSGGQRQLVALARVVIAQPRIWLLDEPTASLDSESEEKVWKALEKKVAPEDILIVATHRPVRALKFATRVIVMREGEVVRDGTPEKIMQQTMPPRTPAAMKRMQPSGRGKPDVI